MLNPNTGIEFGNEVDELRVDNASIVAELSAAKQEVKRLLSAIDEVGVGLFGPDEGAGRTWRDAKASWWQSLLAAVEAAEAAGGNDGKGDMAR